MMYNQWDSQHAANCPVTKEREDLLAKLADDPHNPYLLGAIPEYMKGGDQEVENCTCEAGEYQRQLEADIPYDGDRPPGTSGSWGEA
jgi:hypothetical protein